MTLTPVEDVPGLWRAEDWQKNKPGVYALIVGVSDYPFLGDGAKAAEETFGLEQLISSAGTAARFFDWLRRHFKYGEMELVWCKLLLSPTAAEKGRLAEEGLTHYDTPTNDHLRTAIQWWTGHLPTDKLAADASRSIFFFSGHGVQANNVPLLLPSDYLDARSGQPQFENCISVNELKRWMEGCPLGEHLALLDACRNEFSPLAQKAATAHPVFKINEAGAAAPRGWATLSATSPSMVAYQLPGKPLSVFGEALIEALQGLRHPSDKLPFLDLVNYVTPRINQILNEGQKTALRQPARQSNDGDQLVVTEFVRERPVDGEAAGLLESFVEYRAIFHTDGFEATRNPKEDAVDTAEALLDAQFEPQLTVAQSIPLRELSTGNEAHRRFGHEYASEVWRHGVELLALSNGRPIAHDDAIVKRVERDQQSSLIRVDLELPRLASGLALVFQGAGDVLRERLVLCLPTNDGAAVPVRLTFRLGDGPSDPRVKIYGLSSCFGPPLDTPESSMTPASVGAYAHLWAVHRQADFGSLAKATALADLDKLKLALDQRALNPTAGVAAALLFAQAGRIAELGGLPGQLSRAFPETPDTAVLWCEALRTALSRGEHSAYGVQDLLPEAARALCELGTRGVPFLAGSVELAQRQTRWLLRQPLDSELRGQVAAVQGMLELAESISIPGGSFMLFSATPRPASLPGTGALDTREILRVIRPSLVDA